MGEGRTNDASRQRIGIGMFLFLCSAVAIYSMSSFFTKLASGFPFMSVQYITCLCGAIMVLGIYAVLWQSALKRVSLNRAYLFRSTGLVYSLIIANCVFGEAISFTNILGSCLILTGLFLLLGEKEKQ